MTDTVRRTAAKQSAADWKGKDCEKGQSQPFWLMLLQKVYSVAEPEKFQSAICLRIEKAIRKC